MMMTCQQQQQQHQQHGQALQCAAHIQVHAQENATASSAVKQVPPTKLTHQPNSHTNQTHTPVIHVLSTKLQSAVPAVLQ
jgi:hypothetical protein